VLLLSGCFLLVAGDYVFIRVRLLIG